METNWFTENKTKLKKFTYTFIIKRFVKIVSIHQLAIFYYRNGALFKPINVDAYRSISHEIDMIIKSVLIHSDVDISLNDSKYKSCEGCYNKMINEVKH